MNHSHSSSSNTNPPVKGLLLTPTILYVHESQKGNPVINHLKNVKWQYTSEIKADYLMNTTAALFLSVRYHNRHPKYIVRRIEEVGNMYRIRILLVLVDDEQQLPILQELNRLAVISNFTLIFSWSNIEAARYLETFKVYENKSSQSIQSKDENEFLPKVHKILSNHIKSVNKTDVITLLDVFQNVQNIFQAKEEQLILCPGIGEKKAKRLHSVFNEPFLKQSSGNKGSSVYEQALAKNVPNPSANETAVRSQGEQKEEDTYSTVPINRTDLIFTEQQQAFEVDISVSTSKQSINDTTGSNQSSKQRKRNIAQIIEIDEDM